MIMKKLVTVFAACAVTGMAMAADSNIVGYVTKTTAANKMDIFGVPFQNIGDTDINVQDVLPGPGVTDGGTDLLRIWNPATATYVAAYYCSETYSSDWNTTYGPGWADSSWVRLDFPIATGQGFWLTTGNDASITIAGEVLGATDNKNSTLANKMDILCNTFPVDINIQDVKPVSGVTDGGTDLLRIWNPATATYVAAYYCSETYSSDWNTTYGPGWADSSWVRLDFPITAGQGFWLTTGADAVIEFPVPAAL